jgi:hypothetical protein
MKTVSLLLSVPPSNGGIDTPMSVIRPLLRPSEIYGNWMGMRLRPYRHLHCLITKTWWEGSRGTAERCCFHRKIRLKLSGTVFILETSLLTSVPDTAISLSLFQAHTLILYKFRPACRSARSPNGANGLLWQDFIKWNVSIMFTIECVGLILGTVLGNLVSFLGILRRSTDIIT